MKRDLLIHLGAIVLLFLLEILGIFSDYHQGNFARILVLTVYGIGYNVLFGYTGLLSLGHALFFTLVELLVAMKVLLFNNQVGSFYH